MENLDLFTHLAEIAGVFVGFGALISIRSESSRDEYEVAMIRMIVWLGVVVVVTALAPVVISDYGVTGHGLWVTSTVLFLALWWGGGRLMDRLNPERSRYLAMVSSRDRLRMEMPTVLLWVPMNAALIMILIGVFPDQERALYLTAVSLNLFITASLLLYLVYQQGRPRPQEQPRPPSTHTAT